jgi:predicted glycosyltransferase
MNILIDIGHPAHVHYFRNFIKLMESDGHRFLVTARRKEVSHELLHAYGIPFVDRGTGSDSMLGKLMYMPKADLILWREAKKFRPDLFMSFSSPYAAQVSKLMGKPHIAFDDTEHAALGRRLYRPFTDVVLSPDSYKGPVDANQILFNGYMELLYLHPNRYTPPVDVTDLVPVPKGSPYVLLRFVSWNATHDKGHAGMSLENKRLAVKSFSEYAHVLISSEAALPEDLEPYRIRIPPHRMHDVLNHASLFFGESATMASESAVLGTPAIYLDNDGRGYTDDLEHRYGLVFNFTESEIDQKQAIQKGVEILSDHHQAKHFESQRQLMLQDRMDVTAYLHNFITDYLMDRKG